MSIKAHGIPLDSLFRQGAGTQTTKMKVNGQDIGARYLPYTNGAKVPPTGLVSNAAGTDICNLFQKIDVPPPAPPPPPGAPPPPPPPAPAPPPVTASVSPSSLGGVGGPGTIGTSSAASAAAYGGTGSGYGYTWVLVSGDAAIVPSTQGSSSTAFNRPGCASGMTYTAVYRCDVRDSAGTMASSNTVSINLQCLQMTASVQPQDASASGTNNLQVSCITMDSVGPVTYSWTFANNPGNAAQFVGSTNGMTVTIALSPGRTRASGTVQCFASDGVTNASPQGNYYIDSKEYV